MAPRPSKRIVFFHPDLGIGGAERLIVDAAVGLQQLGHVVTIFTSHCDPSHCFDEARNGTLDVRVRGNTVIPPSFLNRFVILCAVLRQFHLVLQTCLFSSELARLAPDAFFVDQLSACIPILQQLNPSVRVLFYCHFPDKLLAQRKGELKRLYRIPFDWLESWTTGRSDVILVNSKFTRGIFGESFPSLRHRDPKVVYPCVDVPSGSEKAQEKALEPGIESAALWKNKRVILSINRFERKKNVDLAIKAFAGLHEKTRRDARLVIAGGYDLRMSENVGCHKELVALSDSLGLRCATAKNFVSALSLPPDIAVIFLLSVPSSLKATLLRAASLLVYTPKFEHFGIVPLEAMLAERTVLAAKTGGPTETVVDGRTGWLRDVDDPGQWTKVMDLVLSGLGQEELLGMGQEGRKHVLDRFSRRAMASKLEAEILSDRPLRDRPLQSRGSLLLLAGGSILACLSMAQPNFYADLAPSPDAMDWTPTGPYRQTLKRRASQLRLQHSDLSPKRQRLMMLYDETKHLQIKYPVPGAFPLGRPDYPRPPSSPMASPLATRRHQKETTPASTSNVPESTPVQLPSPPPSPSVAVGKRKTSLPGAFTITPPESPILGPTTLANTCISTDLIPPEPKSAPAHAPERDPEPMQVGPKGRVAWHGLESPLTGPSPDASLNRRKLLGSKPVAPSMTPRHHQLLHQVTKKTLPQTQHKNLGPRLLELHTNKQLAFAPTQTLHEDPPPVSFRKVIRNPNPQVVPPTELKTSTKAFAVRSAPQSLHQPSVAGAPTKGSILKRPSVGRKPVSTARRVCIQGEPIMYAGEVLPAQVRHYVKEATMDEEVLPESFRIPQMAAEPSSPASPAPSTPRRLFTDEPAESPQMKTPTSVKALTESFNRLFKTSPVKTRELDRKAEEKRQREKAAQKAKDDEALRVREEEAEKERQKVEKELLRLRQIEAEEKAAKEAKEKEEEEKRKSQSIIKPPGEEWDSKIQEILATTGERELTKSGLKHRDFMTLVSPDRRGTVGWLNDEIVNTYLAAVVAKRLEAAGYSKQSGKPPQYHAFSTFLWKTFQDRGFAGVERWFSRAKINGSRLLSVERILIPINTGVHWTLLSISGTKRTIEYYDSMGGDRPIPKLFENFALALLEGTLGDAFQPDEWQVPKTASQQQDNGQDCGVFVCINGLALGLDKTPYEAFHPSHMAFARETVAATLLGKEIELE
ncbi:MAG: Alpha-1,3-mannosyltransferase-like protein [Chrysothrix sp. TS-e1954]|nr:MAG: Alpha-1,3-mannosyltransferase-like protein [Chrysothrix sp. TS-e1954]